MNTDEEMLEIITQVTEDVFDVEDIVVTEDTSADDFEEWDSLSHIRFIISIERRFKVKFANEDIAGLKNIGALVHVLKAKLADAA